MTARKPDILSAKINNCDHQNVIVKDSLKEDKMESILSLKYENLYKSATPVMKIEQERTTWHCTFDFEERKGIPTDSIKQWDIIYQPSSFLLKQGDYINPRVNPYAQKTELPTPSDRIYYSITAGKDCVYIFGGVKLYEHKIVGALTGTGDLLCYDFKAHKLTKLGYITESKRWPIQVYGHTCLAIDKTLPQRIAFISGLYDPNSYIAQLPIELIAQILSFTGRGDLLVRYGGVSNEKSSVYTLNLGQPAKRRRWQRMSWATGPEDRLLHSAVQYKNSIIVFGGLKAKSFNVNCGLMDCWKLDMVSWKWTKLANAPRGMFNHCAFVFKNVMAVFGGIQGANYDSTEYLMYDIKNNAWRVLQSQNSSSFFQTRAKDLVVGFKFDYENKVITAYATQTNALNIEGMWDNSEVCGVKIAKFEVKPKAAVKERKKKDKQEQASEEEIKENKTENLEEKKISEKKNVDSQSTWSDWWKKIWK